MRRRAGTGLVTNELRILLIATDLQAAGRARFHGYELAHRLAESEGVTGAMSQPTVYRALRRLEGRGALTSEWESLADAAADGREGRPRRYYRVTSAGVGLAERELRERHLQWRAGKLAPSPGESSG